MSSDFAAWLALASPLILRLFVIIDPLGNVPMFLAALRHSTPKRARQITVREMIAALFVILFFTLFGLPVLNCIDVDPKTMNVAGGSVLLVIAVKMILPADHHAGGTDLQEPFIFPLAVPLIAGPSVMATVIEMAKAHPMTLLLTSLLLAWSLSTVVLVAASLLQRYLGEEGTIALERLMGLILMALSVQMIFDGLIEVYQIGNSTPLPI